MQLLRRFTQGELRFAPVAWVRVPAAFLADALTPKVFIVSPTKQGAPELVSAGDAR